GDLADESTDLLVVMLAIEGDHDLHPGGAGGLGIALEREAIEDGPDEAGHVLDLGECGRGKGVESEEGVAGMALVAAAGVQRMKLDGTEVDHEENVRGVVHGEVVDGATVVALDSKAWHPRGRVPGRVLLVEERAANAVGHALQGEGALAHVRQER